MKKILAFLMAAMLLSGAAMATEPVIEATPIPADSCVQMDLDGDGQLEKVSWMMKPGEYDSYLNLYIENAGYTTFSAELPIIWTTGVYAVDLNGDGAVEILLSGDMMSDDYCTYCFNYTPDGLIMLSFEDITRGGEHTGYYDYGYGYVYEIANGEIALMGSQDVLGTYFGFRRLALNNGVFETCDDGLWRFDIDVTDPEMWEYRALNPVVDLPAVFIDDENQHIESQLLAGERIMISASDTETIAYFITEDGARGYLELEPDAENWGSKIGGIAESEAFEFVPYAD